MSGARRWILKLVLLVGLALAPWPGWGEAWGDFYCELANPLADAAALGGIRALVRPGDDAAQGEVRAPWKVYVYLRRADGAIERVVENERMDYVSLATFLALVIATALEGGRTRRLWTLGLPVLLGILTLNDANRIVLALERLGWIALGPAGAVVLSAFYTLFNGLPIAPFALPGILFWSFAPPSWSFGRTAASTAGTPDGSRKETAGAPG